MAKSLKYALRPLVYYLPDRLAAQRRQRELAGSRRHVTAADLRADVNRLPLPGRPMLLLHISLKAIDFVDGVRLVCSPSAKSGHPNI
jgi:hypothetical protein